MKIERNKTNQDGKESVRQKRNIKNDDVVEKEGARERGRGGREKERAGG